MKNTHILLFILSGAFLVACAPAPPTKGAGGHSRITKTQKNFEIEFVVQGGGGPSPKLKVVTPNQGCAKKDDGCMHVKTTNTGKITFKFQNTQKLPCSENPNSWIISKIELADFPKSFGVAVSPWIVEDFGADRTNGIVWQTKGKEVVSVNIDDANKYTGVAYYQVTAKSCKSDQTASTDPRIENEGIGY